MSILTSQPSPLIFSLFFGGVRASAKRTLGLFSAELPDESANILDAFCTIDIRKIVGWKAADSDARITVVVCIAYEFVCHAKAEVMNPS